MSEVLILNDLRNISVLIVFSSLFVINCQTKANESAVLGNNKTLSEYCRSFALKYSDNHSYTYKEQSIFVERKNLLDRTLNQVYNVFLPKGSKFITGYDCLFQVEDNTEGGFYDISVGLFLVETQEFAQHTTEGQEEGQIIPIEYIRDKSNQGYGVFKFLKKTKSLNTQ